MEPQNMSFHNTWISHISLQIGPSIPPTIVEELFQSNATHVSFHDNKLTSLELEVEVLRRCRKKCNLKKKMKNKRFSFKNDDSVRSVNSANGLDHIVDLDLSSNFLNEGKCTPLSFSSTCRRVVSLLTLTPFLRKLNLSSNGLTEKSIVELFSSASYNLSPHGRTNSEDAFTFNSTAKTTSTSIILPHLQFLDISYNNISLLPNEFCSWFPNLQHLVATNNKLRSLTSLLQVLHSFRGQLHVLHLFYGGCHESCYSNNHGSKEHLVGMDKNSKIGMSNLNENNNPVCYRDMYREKIIFVLGSTLSTLDCIKITKEEQETVRRKLEKLCQTEKNQTLTNEGDAVLKLEPLKSRNSTCSDAERKTRENRKLRLRKKDELENKAVKNSDEPVNKLDVSSDEKLNNLEDKILSLSSLVQIQTNLTKNLLETSRKDKVVNSNSNRLGCVQSSDASGFVFPANQIKREISKKSELLSPNPSIRDVEILTQQKRLLGDLKHSACGSFSLALLKLVLVIKNRSKRIHICFAFLHWRSCTRLIVREHKFKDNLTQLKMSCQAETKDLIINAVSEEVERGMKSLSVLKDTVKIASEKNFELNKTVCCLEAQLNSEKCRHVEAENELRCTIEKLTFNIKELEVNLNKKSEDLNAQIKISVDLEKALKDLSATKDELEALRARSFKLELDNKVSIQLRKDTATEYIAELEDLKLQNAQKDVSIKQLKSAFEKFAIRAAKDRSNCEEASLAERQAKELLLAQTRKLQDVEAELLQLLSIKNNLETTIVDHKTKISSLQTKVGEQSLSISTLMKEVDELKLKLDKKDQTINKLEHKLKVITYDNDEVHKQLKGTITAKLQLEERSNNLHSQLNQAHDEIRTLKQYSIEKNRLDIEISRSNNLQRKIQQLDQSSKEREWTLHSTADQMIRKNAELLENASRDAQLVKSLTGKLQLIKTEWKVKETQILAKHNLEIQKLSSDKEQEVLALKMSYDTEKKLHLEAEKEAAALNAALMEQKLKMQGVIEGLAKQLA